MGRSKAPAVRLEEGLLISVRSRRSGPGGSVRWLALLLVVTSLVGCSLSRPDRVIEPDVVGVVTATDRRSVEVPLTIELGDRSLQIDEHSAMELTGPGIGPGMLLLYGEDGGRAWYVTAAIRQTSPTPNCYTLRGDAAFDTPGAVLFVFAECLGCEAEDSQMPGPRHVQALEPLHDGGPVPQFGP